jgi:hypothetical protein
MCWVTLAVHLVVPVRHQEQQNVVQEHCRFDVVLVKQFHYCAVWVPGVVLDMYPHHQLPLVSLQDEQRW